MKALYLWPEHVAALAARALGRQRGVSVGGARADARRCCARSGNSSRRAARVLRAGVTRLPIELRKRARAALLAAGRLEAQGRLVARDQPHRQDVHRAARAVLGSLAAARRPAREARGGLRGVRDHAARGAGLVERRAGDRADSDAGRRERAEGAREHPRVVRGRGGARAEAAPRRHLEASQAARGHGRRAGRTCAT